MTTQYWLMKTEPNVFSIDDLNKSLKKTTCWEGVRNYQARNLLRDKIKKGDVLMEVDLDYIRENAKSDITPIIITGPAGTEIAARELGSVTNDDVVINIK